jgi:hypothetical protein
MNGLCIFFSIKLPPTSKGDVDNGKAIDINIRKGLGRKLVMLTKVYKPNVKLMVEVLE